MQLILIEKQPAYYSQQIFFFVLVILCLGCGSNIQNTHYILDEIDLVPEGIAFSEAKQKYYISSVAKSKIISVDKAGGEQEDFIHEQEYGFMPGVGVLVDDDKNVLHALCGHFRLNDSLTSLFTFDLDSKALLKRYSLQDKEGSHFLNDLIMDNLGTIYITDSKAAAVYQIRPEANSLELFLKSDEIQYPNGIAISDDQTKLYVAAHLNGVRIIDIKTRTILNGKDSLGISSRIDGLEFYNNHLYAVQYGSESTDENFRKIVLSENQAQIIGAEELSTTSGKLNVALTFCIEHNRAVVIGNSNLQYLDQEKFIITNPDSLEKTRLLIYDL